jgi:proteic killer suppression protein
MIRSVNDPETELVWRHQRSRRLPPDVQCPVLRKPIQLDAADELNDLRLPSGRNSPELFGGPLKAFPLRSKAS